MSVPVPVSQCDSTAANERTHNEASHNTGRGADAAAHAGMVGGGVRCEFESGRESNENDCATQITAQRDKGRPGRDGRRRGNGY